MLNLLPYLEGYQLQSMRVDRYRHAERVLKDNLYYCTCSRTDLRSRGLSDQYDGYCRDKQRNQGHIRIKLSNDRNDPILRNKDNMYSYFFANVIDDIDSSVNLVIRGNDLANFTDLQGRLFSSLGYETPEYIHHELLLNDDGEKLSKRNNDLPVALNHEYDYLPRFMEKIGYNQPFSATTFTDLIYNS